MDVCSSSYYTICVRRHFYSPVIQVRRQEVCRAPSITNILLCSVAFYIIMSSLDCDSRGGQIIDVTAKSLHNLKQKQFEIVQTSR